MISVSNLSIHFSGEYLFRDVSFLVNERDRIGLVGRNGTGKTTLLKVLSKEIEPESGVISLPSHRSIGYLPQEMATGSDLSVKEEASKAFSEVIGLKNQLDTLSKALAEREDYESDEYHRLIHRYNDANDRYHLMEGDRIDEKAEKVLKGLGFEPQDLTSPLNTFSGGWQMRVELAKILLRMPDIILLDEPTNHLDIESIQWLEEFLTVYPGAVILVSHDRTFLDNITTRTLEIMNGRIYDYKAGYSDYLSMREEQIEHQKAAYDNQQAQIAQIERFIERFRYKLTKARQVQSRIKMLDKMEVVEVDSIDRSAIHFVFPPAPRSGKVVIEASALGKTYGTKTVFRNLEFLIAQGDFVAFVGRNGEGKTTLSKIIAENLEHDGTCKLGHNVVVGYYAQNQAELLNPDKTVFQTIDEVAVGEIRPKIRAILGSFLFGDDAIEKKVKVLSGGEKARLALAKLLLKPVNLLVLDEPTNHLDMVSKDILKNALLKYDGTLLIVSHDRDFLQGLTDKVFEFRNQSIRVWLGDVFDFLKARKIEALSELETKNSVVRQGKSEETVSDNKVIYERKKQYEKEIRKAASRVDKVEAEISSLENEISRYDIILADPASHSDSTKSAALFKQYQLLRKQLDDLMEQWEIVHQELENTRKNAP